MSFFKKAVDAILGSEESEAGAAGANEKPEKEENGEKRDKREKRAAAPSPLASLNPEQAAVLVQLLEVLDARLEQIDARLEGGGSGTATLEKAIGNIAPMVDPAIRTAKVRLEVENPGLMRLGMFVTATFHGQTAEKHATVPASAILHLHDREWVFVPVGDGSFRQLEVVSGVMLPDKMQEIVSGIKPGDRVISNALVFQNTVEQ